MYIREQGVRDELFRTFFTALLISLLWSHNGEASGLIPGGNATMGWITQEDE
jgi:hypothetical protein